MKKISVSVRQPLGFFILIQVYIGIWYEKNATPTKYNDIMAYMMIFMMYKDCWNYVIDFTCASTSRTWTEEPGHISMKYSLKNVSKIKKTGKMKQKTNQCW